MPRRGAERLVMIGWREWVGIPELEDAPLLGKMDTGAWSVSYTHLTLPTILLV